MKVLGPCTGRCTCGGEGRCAWCMEMCELCGGIGIADEPWHVCEACNGTGYADGLELTAEERAAKVAAIRAEDVDYEALGYPETEECDFISVGGLDGLAETLDLLVGFVLGDLHERIQKIYP